MSLYRDSGVVLRTHKLGEADRIITILTRDHGKVRAVAKGVRKTKSRFGGRLEAPVHADLQFYEGRELDIITQAETLDAFALVRQDLECLARAMSMLEAVDLVALERQPSPELYRMLVRALRTLTESQAPLVVPAFFLKLLALEGLQPEVHACTVCGDDDDLVAWAVEDGGLRCRAHRQGRGISGEAVVVAQRILGGQLGAVLAEPVSPGAVTDVEQLAVQMLEHHLERRLRSLASLHRG